jgi:hypothetical protein
LATDVKLNIDELQLRGVELDQLQHEHRSQQADLDHLQGQLDLKQNALDFQQKESMQQLEEVYSPCHLPLYFLTIICRSIVSEHIYLR